MPNEPLVDLPEFSLVRRWTVVIQTPVHALDALVSAIERNVELRQGAYSRCMYVRSAGQLRFKNEDGSHGGAEDNARQVESAEIILVLPHDTTVLTETLLCIRHHHVHEEPTISVTENWGYLSGSKDDGRNPNRYWNRKDATDIHGVMTSP